MTHQSPRRPEPAMLNIGGIKMTESQFRYLARLIITRFKPTAEKAIEIALRRALDSGVKRGRQNTIHEIMLAFDNANLNDLMTQDFNNEARDE